MGFEFPGRAPEPPRPCLTCPVASEAAARACRSVYLYVAVTQQSPQGQLHGRLMEPLMSTLPNRLHGCVGTILSKIKETGTPELMILKSCHQVEA